MKRLILYAIWILFLDSTLLSDATRPSDILTKPYPNVIYRYDNGIRIAMAGDTCNYDHRNVTSDNDTLELDFSAFDTKCNPPSECNFVLDSEGDPISLSLESFLVKDYKLGKDTMTLMSVVYFKKCICPADHYFTHLTGSCSSSPEVQEQLYCEDSTTVNSITFETLTLCMTLGIVIG